MSNFQSYTAFEAPAEEAPVTTWHATRVHDSAYRVSTTDGVMTESVLKQESGRLAELNPFHGTDSIFANARNANGLPVTEILPTTLVEIGGVQAPVSFFVSEGILQRNADGTYGEPTAPPRRPRRMTVATISRFPSGPWRPSMPPWSRWNRRT